MTVTFRWWEKGTGSRTEEAGRRKKANVHIKISENTTKTLKDYFLHASREVHGTMNKPGKHSELVLLQNPCIFFLLAKFCILTLRFPVRKPTSYCFTIWLLKTALETAPQVKKSCLRLINSVFRLLQSTGDCLSVLNTLAMPLAFCLPVIYLAHAHTLYLIYQFCISFPCPSIPQQLEWGKSPREKESGPVVTPRPLDYKLPPVFFHACLCLNLPVPQGKTARAQPQQPGPAGTWTSSSSPHLQYSQALEILTYPVVSCNRLSSMGSGAWRNYSLRQPGSLIWYYKSSPAPKNMEQMEEV